MKVYIQYKYGAKDSPQFKYLTDNPPKDVEYLNWKRGKDVTTLTNELITTNTQKRNIKNFIFKHDLPIPNASIVAARFPFDIVHAINTIPLTTKPFIVEFEMFWQPFLCNINNKFAIKIVKFLLTRKNCKSILVWSKLTKKHLLDILDNDERIAKKFHVVYPAVRLQRKNRTNNDKKLTLGFISRYFNEKGGDIALKTMEFCPKHRSIVVSDTSNITFRPRNVLLYPLLDRQKLIEEIYPEIDVLIYPGFSDSFGFIFLEAMSFGIPIITVNGYSRTEIVHPNQNGLVVNSILDKWGQYSLSNNKDTFINKLVAAVVTLQYDRDLYNKISDTNYDCIKRGRFSIKTRNNKLLQLYKEAIK